MARQITLGPQVCLAEAASLAGAAKHTGALPPVLRQGCVFLPGRTSCPHPASSSCTMSQKPLPPRFPPGGGKPSLARQADPGVRTPAPSFPSRLPLAEHGCCCRKRSPLPTPALVQQDWRKAGHDVGESRPWGTGAWRAPCQRRSQ